MNHDPQLNNFLFLVRFLVTKLFHFSTPSYLLLLRLSYYVAIILVRQFTAFTRPLYFLEVQRSLSTQLCQELSAWWCRSHRERWERLRLFTSWEVRETERSMCVTGVICLYFHLPYKARQTGSKQQTLFLFNIFLLKNLFAIRILISSNTLRCTCGLSCPAPWAATTSPSGLTTNPSEMSLMVISVNFTTLLT